MRANFIVFHSVKLKLCDISVDLFVQDFIIMSNTNNNNKRLLKAFRPIPQILLADKQKCKWSADTAIGKD